MALNLDPVFAGNSPFFWIPRSYFAGASQAMVGPGQMPVKKNRVSADWKRASSQRRDELGFPHHHSRTIPMAVNSEANIATADALTLLLHNQHALAAAIEEVALTARTSGSPEAHSNAIAALETLDANASVITDAIMRLRQS
jgi:hypothetical protein